MIAVWTKSQIEDHLTESFRQWYKRKDVNITGLLFARPELETTQKHVLPNLDHWNYRSDCYTEFFCVGFRLKPTDRERDQKSIVTVNGTRWYFSAESFNEVLNDIERQTKWRYKSGCYLIITNTRFDPKTQRARIDFRHAIVVNIAKAIASGAVESADELAHEMFEFAKKINEGKTIDPVWEFSDSVGLAIFKRSLTDQLVDLLPKLARKILRRGENFVVKELEPSGAA